MFGVEGGRSVALSGRALNCGSGQQGTVAGKQRSNLKAVVKL